MSSYGEETRTSPPYGGSENASFESWIDSVCLCDKEAWPVKDWRSLNFCGSELSLLASRAKYN